MSCSEGEEELGEGVADFDPVGSGPKGVGTLFKTVTQAMFLFGAETWVRTPRMERCSIPCSIDITRGSSLVVNHRTEYVRVTSDRPDSP